jgi:GMP synthase-like glutamine amidotransferase
MASALGAEVKTNPEPEIGWWPIEYVSTPSAPSLTVLHWHGETFELPAGAVHLERSEGCEHQSFRWGNRAIGLQYHLEATQNSLNALVTNCREEITPARYIQTEAQLLRGWEQHHLEAETHLYGMLTDLTSV